mmetsp:Transcript_59535/g.127884  ORF Transcript_59535/g.127884 Transcript_59535/m.127884 type:complete len:98 (-) Transcript_59535:1314-1607(-)
MSSASTEVKGDRCDPILSNCKPLCKVSGVESNNCSEALRGCAPNVYGSLVLEKMFAHYLRCASMLCRSMVQSVILIKKCNRTTVFGYVSQDAAEERP